MERRSLMFYLQTGKRNDVRHVHPETSTKKSEKLKSCTRYLLISERRSTMQIEKKLKKKRDAE